MPAESDPPYEVVVGIDIAAVSATIIWMSSTQVPSAPMTIPQSPEGFARLHQALQTLPCSAGKTLLVLEATGSYWIALATAFAQWGYAVSVLNPAQAHSFAQALLKRAKTDVLDALILAQFGRACPPSLWTPPPAISDELSQRLGQRDTLLGLRQQVRNQRHALVQRPVVVASVLARLEALETTLTQQVESVEQELETIVSEQLHPWTETVIRLQSIPGIGLITAAWLVVSTLNFTICETVEQLTAYAGLAPMLRQSGTSLHKRPCIGHAGHRRLRSALYMASLSAAQHNPSIRPFHERLRAKGKPAKVVRCASARKLLHLAWAIGRSGTVFDPSYHLETPGV
jgi:transposase